MSRSDDNEKIEKKEDLAEILGGLEPENENAAKQIKDALEEEGQ